MTKMRVHELAKELGVDNKDLMEALKKKDVEVKSHMSSLEDNVVADLKKEFGKSAGAEKAGEKKEEAPKKKTIMQVFRPQNAKNSGRGSSNRPAGARPGCRTRRSTSDRCSRREPRTERSTLTGEQKSGKPSAGQRKSAPWG